MPSTTFTNDELILVLISLVRAAHPTMLRQDKDGFSVDFEPLTKKKKLSADDRLLLKIREKMEAATGPAAIVVDFADWEGARLAATLAQLEKLQEWPDDVLAMSRSLRLRLKPSL